MNQHASAQSPFQIEIPRRAPQCIQCQAHFQKGEEYYSTVVSTHGQEGIERRDYCTKCASHLTKEKGNSFWKSAIPPQKVPSDLPKKKEERALLLLKEAIASNDPQRYPEAFVLALFLARRRVIYQRQEMAFAKGVQGIIYEVAETEEMVCVPKIALSDLQVGKIQQELARKFA